MGEKFVRDIVEKEWAMFEAVNSGSGQKASCQEDPQTFYIMRSSQAEAWTEELRESYYQDLLSAEAEGRNLMTEKYARMMESTDPLYYETIRDLLPALNKEMLENIEKIIQICLKWKEESSRQYPRLAARGRPIHTQDDSPWATSFETYLRGELQTFSPRTVRLYLDMVLRMDAAGESLEQKCLLNTARRYGYRSLEEADRMN